MEIGRFSDSDPYFGVKFGNFTCLSRQSKSLAALSLNSSDSGAKSPLALSADHQMNGGNLVRIRRRIIAPSAQNLAESENQRIEEKGEEIGKNKPPKVPTKPAIR